ncbi:exodeoxyribonuclease VII large subunit [Sinirhodobacter populi]|uniref:Exodeoxyribonuclease 7 large subunit n=1 Tax=Paenirhodobacter populi TaxID=2306993 RepID=A0A443KIY4_9RHOB|nr:exodeoxyribonuclease VII large subunit [Sinirhodobacter populi]RWR32694.1 exodeoxyribonuclease VII large subunit [Sinirhodobacter populi]
MDLLEDGPTGNAHEYTVSEISGAVKRVIEGEFGRVRVRGEVGRVSRPASGHMYFDLKDQGAVIAAVSWKGQVARMQIRPEEGMEVIATGRLTTFPGQSKYQLIVDNVEPAGAGALMAMLEARRKALAAEGLFDQGRKRDLPWLPEVIGVVTSPSGAVIRDILHRLRERFPRRVLIWPVAVQGQACAPEVAAAIRGFNALAPGGPVPRPHLIIVARGGGSLEDLWGFNEEIVVRAAAESVIPLISAVGHETDTTLIDFAADRRAPTPTAAAEIAVPVRTDLANRLGEAALRMARAMQARGEARAQRLSDLSRLLGRPEALVTPARQRFDLVSERLGPGLRMVVVRKRAAFAPLAAHVSPRLLRQVLTNEARRIDQLAGRLRPAPGARLRRAQQDLSTLSQRLEAARQRSVADVARRNREGRAQLAILEQRLAQVPRMRFVLLRERLDRLDRMRQTLGYRETLRRGFAVVRDAEGALLTTAAEARGAPLFEVEFRDGRVTARPQDPPPAAPQKPRPARSRRKDPPEQGDLF